MNVKTKVPTWKYNKGRIRDTNGMFCQSKDAKMDASLKYPVMD